MRKYREFGGNDTPPPNDLEVSRTQALEIAREDLDGPGAQAPGWRSNV